MKQLMVFLIVTLFCCNDIEAKNYNNKDEVRKFINLMVTKHHFSRAKLKRLFRDVKFQRGALGMFNPAYRKKPDPNKPRVHYTIHGSWDRQEKALLKKSRVDKGVAYMHKYRSIFQKVYKRYGVEPEYVTAIIGIESYYGYNTGKFPAFDVLTTLAFEPNRRKKYFKYELENLLRLSQKEKFNPKNVRSSFAGAIGLGQFMPSSYDAFAVDFNGDGRRSLLTTSDAIASVANYFKKNGWKKGQPIATRVSYNGMRYKGKKTGYKYKYSRNSLVGIRPKNAPWPYAGKVRLIKLDRYKYDELWYGAKNFYVITRYNHSSYYAMAVHQLAQKIKKAYSDKYGKIMR